MRFITACGGGIQFEEVSLVTLALSFSLTQAHTHARTSPSADLTVLSFLSETSGPVVTFSPPSPPLSSLIDPRTTPRRAGEEFPTPPTCAGEQTPHAL